MTAEDIQDIYELTSVQEGIFYNFVRDPDSAAYFEQLCFTLHGSFNTARYEHVLNELFKRHDVLRTVFVQKDAHPVLQIVLKTRKAECHFEDVSNLTDVTGYIGRYREQEKKKSFNLSRDTLMRVAVFKMADDEHKIVWSYHHILLDGWSVNKLFNEILIQYLGSDSLPPVPLYADYIRWFRKRDIKATEHFWSHYLEGVKLQTGIPFSKTKSDKRNYRGEDHVVSFNTAASDKVREVCAANQVTINTFVSSVWAVILSLYNQTHDVVFGTVISHRPREINNIGNLVGLCINTIPVRVTIGQGIHFNELMKQVQQSASACLPHQFFPLAEMSSMTEVRRNLFNHILSFNNFPLDKSIEAFRKNQSQDSWTISEVEFLEQTDYPLNLIFVPRESLQLRVRYDADIYTMSAITRLERYLRSVIDQVVGDPNMRVSELCSFPDDSAWILERNAITTSFESMPLSLFFERQVAKTPSQVAVQMEDQSMTYAELDTYANRFAWFMVEQCQLKTKDVVAVYMSSSFEMVAAILGAFKAGAIVFPMDSTTPSARAEALIERSEASIVFTNIAEMQFTGTLSNTMCVAMDQSLESIRRQKDGRMDVDIDPESIAYLLFTSGSTGKPKGASLTHRNLANQFYWFRSYFDFLPTDVLPQKTVLGFGDAIIELLFPITLGESTLYLRPHDQLILEGESFIRWLQKIKTTWIQFVPSVFEELNAVCDITSVTTLKGIILSGEKIKQLKKLSIPCFNMYGCSEGTSVSTIHHIQYKDDFNVIGKPVSNTSIYVLNDTLDLVPPLVIGEIYIGGESVCAGYYRDEDLSRQKFVADPFREGYRMYRTGDLGRWDENGNLHYCGRRDSQVKIRGVRMELEEIEQVLNVQQDVESAVVVACLDDSGETYLTAFIAAKTSAETEASHVAQNLRTELADKLPAFMIPSYFVPVDKFPMNVNGKVDRNVLLAMAKDVRSKVSVQHVSETQFEHRIANIWEEILDHPSVDVTADFFEIGGHSLKAMRLASRINKEFGTNLGIADIFTFTTVRGMASLIESRVGPSQPGIEPQSGQAHYPVSFSQRRLWILSQANKNFSAYNMVSCYLLEGALDKNMFTRAFQLLVQRHEVLRTNFVQVEGEPRQVIHVNTKAVVKYITHSSSTWESAIEQLVAKETKTPFDLATDPLIRCFLVEVDTAKHICVLAMHHIVSDGWSMRILTRDFMLLYRSLLSGDENELPTLPIHYKDYAHWQHKNRDGNFFEAQRKFWTTRLKQAEYIKLPFDFAKPLANPYTTKSIEHTFDVNTTEQLGRIVKDLRVSHFSIFVSAVSLFLHHITQQQTIVLGSPISGRNHVDLDNQIGFYINMIVLLNTIRKECTCREFMKQVHDRNGEAFAHQDYPFDLLSEAWRSDHRDRWTPFFNVLIDFHKFDATAGLVSHANLRVREWQVPSLHGGKCDVDFIFSQEQDVLRLKLYYNTALFYHETAEELLHGVTDTLSVINNGMLRESNIASIQNTIQGLAEQRLKQRSENNKRHRMEKLLQYGNRK